MAGEDINDAERVSEEFNKFFIAKIKGLTDGITSNGDDPPHLSVKMLYLGLPLPAERPRFFVGSRSTPGRTDWDCSPPCDDCRFCRKTSAANRW